MYDVILLIAAYNVIHFIFIFIRLQTKEESKNMGEVKLVYMCGECSNCFSSIEDCKEHMINVIILLGC